ncbi:MAG: glycosyltransferase family A protein, partial [Moraxellaceae bacterium]|nr:glycosyltransferase family A protein [Moraxellaceae bacterium]
MTIALPTRDRPDLLRETIQSILAQTMTDFEVIISDNGRTDETKKLVARMGDDRFLLFQHRPNLTLAGNWRFALTAGSAPLVSFIHDDDLYAPDHLDHLVSS